MNALEKFAELGIQFSKPTITQVEMPQDITALSSEQLAEKFTELTAWADYIASQLAMAQIEERMAQKKLDFAENTMLVRRMNNGVKGERVTYVKAEISVDPQIQELSQTYDEKYAYRKLVEMLLNNHERDLALVSREITRRTHDQRAMRKDWGV